MKQINVMLMALVLASLWSGMLCSMSRSCPLPEFDCGNGNCVVDHLLCNGVDDCGNGFDENEMDCPPPTASSCQDEFELTCSNGNCVAKGNLCDGADDCGDGSDEREQDCYGTTSTLGPSTTPAPTTTVETTTTTAEATTIGPSTTPAPTTTVETTTTTSAGSNGGHGKSHWSFNRRFWRRLILTKPQQQDCFCRALLKQLRAVQGSGVQNALSQDGPSS